MTFWSSFLVNQALKRLVNNESRLWDLSARKFLLTRDKNKKSIIKFIQKVNALQWSKLKTNFEGFLSDKLKGSIEIHATVYRKFHDSPSRIWITLDKQEILSASDVTFAVKHEKLYQQIIKEEELNEIPYNTDLKAMLNSQERKELIKASDIAEKVMINQNIFGSYHLYDALMNYSSLSIVEALNSDNMIIRAFSMLDRRLGKRRLGKLTFSKDTHPLVVKFYNIRCEVESTKNFD
ncbi:SF0329 family protein [Niallia taxi]|uniref:SF0329 family protein n=1 Tax=Niallia taxi TaxID=2499688 RepID=UPI002AA5C902|nr:nonribosomal peptide synthetase [Niallia taxi]MED3960993.1 nonribosomal peptide synthetase [Niallia taxi]